MTMYEISYIYLEDCFHDTGYFFSSKEWEAFQKDCAEAGSPVKIAHIETLTPEEFWEKAQREGLEYGYAVELMANAVMGQEWASQYDKWRDQEKALKELGII